MNNWPALSAQFGQYFLRVVHAVAVGRIGKGPLGHLAAEAFDGLAHAISQLCVFLDEFWRKVAQEIMGEYPDVTTDFMYVDNAAMRMIQDPRFFDVMVTENTFGDILTDEGSVITGSMGLLPSASTGEHTPVFEPIHGSWPQGKGLNIANPLAQILSAAMLFEYFDLKEEGALIREAVNASLDQNVRTPEIQVEGGAKYGTKEVGQWIVDYINKK